MKKILTRRRRPAGRPGGRPVSPIVFYRGSSREPGEPLVFDITESEEWDRCWVYTQSALPSDLLSGSYRGTELVQRIADAVAQGSGGIVVRQSPLGHHCILDAARSLSLRLHHHIPRAHEGMEAPAGSERDADQGPDREVIRLQAGEKLLVPVDAAAEEQLERFVEGIRGFPEVQQRVVLGELRRPGLDERMEELRTQAAQRSGSRRVLEVLLAGLSVCAFLLLAPNAFDQYQRLVGGGEETQSQTRKDLVPEENDEHAEEDPPANDREPQVAPEAETRLLVNEACESPPRVGSSTDRSALLPFSHVRCEVRIPDCRGREGWG